MNPLFLADAIVVLHLVIVFYVIFGQLAVLIGGLARRPWARNPWFRYSHGLVVIVIVIQAVYGELCFLTHWEADLRRSAGQQTDELSFVARLVRDVLYVEGVPQQTLNRSYYAFGAIVLLSWVLWPPRRRAARPGGDLQRQG